MESNVTVTGSKSYCGKCLAFTGVYYSYSRIFGVTPLSTCHGYRMVSLGV